MSNNITFCCGQQMTDKQAAKDIECTISWLTYDFKKRLDELDTTIKALNSELQSQKWQDRCDICGKERFKPCLNCNK